MTPPDTRRGTGISIYVMYSQLSHEVERMHRYFGAFDSLWDSCLALIDYRYHGPPPEWRDQPRTKRHTKSEMVVPTQKDTPELVVHHMRVGSPMEITFAVQGGAGLVSAYAALLFVRALRSPETIGSWLPRLVEGWHRGWQDVEHQKSKKTGRGVYDPDQLPIPEQARVVRDLTDAGAELRQLNMQANEVTTFGLDELEADLADPNAW